MTFVVSQLVRFRLDLVFLDLGSGLPRGRFLCWLPTAGFYVEWLGSIPLDAVPGQASRLCAVETSFFSDPSLEFFSRDVESWSFPGSVYLHSSACYYLSVEMWCLGFVS